MAHSDPIADYLTRLRNAISAKHRVVEMPSSKMKMAITKVLVDQSFVEKFEEIKDNKQNILRINLKYNDGQPVILGLKRVSTPGLRLYAPSKKMPRIQGGLGVAIISTSKGIMTEKRARKDNLGGEVVCYVW